MSFQPTYTQTVHALNRKSNAASVKHAPKVIWSGLTEPADQFDMRVAQLRKTWKGRILAAVP
jgi:hypothetical protein